MLINQTRIVVTIKVIELKPNSQSHTHPHIGGDLKFKRPHLDSPPNYISIARIHVMPCGLVSDRIEGTTLKAFFQLTAVEVCAGTLRVAVVRPFIHSFDQFKRPSAATRALNL